MQDKEHAYNIKCKKNREEDVYSRTYDIKPHKEKQIGSLKDQLESIKKAIKTVLVKIFNKTKIFRCSIWISCDDSINFYSKERIIFNIKNYSVDEIIDGNTDELISEILYSTFDQKIKTKWYYLFVTTNY